MRMYTPGRFKGKSRKQNRLIRRPTKGIGEIESRHPFKKRRLDGDQVTSLIFDEMDAQKEGVTK